MMEVGTWFAVGMLGPGAVAIFVWFLFDLRAMLRSKPPRQ
jgi:hypothetical protein